MRSHVRRTVRRDTTTHAHHGCFSSRSKLRDSPLAPCPRCEWQHKGEYHKARCHCSEAKRDIECVRHQHCRMAVCERQCSRMCLRELIRRRKPRRESEHGLHLDEHVRLDGLRQLLKAFLRSLPAWIRPPSTAREGRNVFFTTTKRNPLSMQSSRQPRRGAVERRSPKR